MTAGSDREPLIKTRDFSEFTAFVARARADKVTLSLGDEEGGWYVAWEAEA